MNTVLSSIRWNIVDFMGVFLPGLVWVFLFLTAQGLFSAAPPVKDPISILKEVLTDSNLGAAFYTGVSLAALLVGNVIKALSSKPPEFLTHMLVFVLRRSSSTDDKKCWFRIRRAFSIRCCFFQCCFSVRFASAKDRFPYRRAWQGTPLFARVMKLVNDSFGIKWNELPGYQPFEACKELLKIYAPELWLEAQQREAQVRMVASLLLAALFSLVLSLLPAVLAKEMLWGWFATSTILFLLLGSILRKRRRREVEDVYLAILIAENLIREESVNPSKGTPKGEGRHLSIRRS